MKYLIVILLALMFTSCVPEQNICACTIVYIAESGERFDENFPTTDSTICARKAQIIAEDFGYYVEEISVVCY